MVRALAFHQCGPGSIPGPDVICGLSLLLVLFSAPRGFSSGTPAFPSPQKPTLLNSNSIRDARTCNTRALARETGQPLLTLSSLNKFDLILNEPLVGRSRRGINFGDEQPSGNKVSKAILYIFFFFSLSLSLTFSNG